MEVRDVLEGYYVACATASRWGIAARYQFIWSDGQITRVNESARRHRLQLQGSWAKRNNLAHPAMRSPVAGIVPNAGEGNSGRIAIRSSDGFTHEILHSHRQHVQVGDPVAAGQLIGTMGNTGVNREKPDKGPHHVHYQLRDRAGKIVGPGAYWDQEGPIDPNLAPPALLNEHQRYLRILDANPSARGIQTEVSGATSLASASRPENSASAPFGTGGHFVAGPAMSSQPLYETRSFVEPAEDLPAHNTGKEIRRLVRLPASKPDLAGYDPNAPAPLPNAISR